MTLNTIADITPGGVTTALSATAGSFATWIKVAAAGATIRIGGPAAANVDATHGLLLQTGVVTDLPRCSFSQSGYDLSMIFVYGTGGDKVSITYGT